MVKTANTGVYPLYILLSLLIILYDYLQSKITFDEFYQSHLKKSHLHFYQDMII